MPMIRNVHHKAQLQEMLYDPNEMVNMGSAPGQLPGTNSILNMTHGSSAFNKKNSRAAAHIGGPRHHRGHSGNLFVNFPGHHGSLPIDNGPTLQNAALSSLHHRKSSKNSTSHNQDPSLLNVDQLNVLSQSPTSLLELPLGVNFEGVQLQKVSGIKRLENNRSMNN